ncbi:MAG: hypothetical protein Q9195_004674 [Heterodermia aff. obscurata]
MGMRQVGGHFFRYRDTPVLSFLIPSLKARTTWSCSQTLQRSFTASTYFRNDPSQPPLQSADSKFARSVEENRVIQDLLDDTFQRVSKSKTSSSADLLQDSFQAEIHRPEDESRFSREGKIINSMYLPGEKPGEATRTAAALKSAVKPRNTATIRSRPSLGRTVDVSSAGVARALQLLAYEIRDNNVREEQRRQKFHERPGLKRKRLKSERWRKRFKIAFKATLQKVHEMRKKGW